MHFNETAEVYGGLRMLPWRGSRIALRSYGAGPRVTVCLHGFLEDGESFAALARALPGHRLLALDMPFHGRTEWNGGDRLRPDELVDILLLIPELQEGRFGLLGYSMGGRIALSIYQRMPERISHLVLVAPDGLRPDPWHTFFTRTRLGDRILRHTLNDPRGFMRFLHRLRKLRLVNDSVVRFTRAYLGEADTRRRVYRIWTTLRELRPDRHLVIHAIRTYRPPLRLVFGRYDRLCPVGVGQRFARKLDGLAGLDILESGHLLLRPKHTARLAAAFPPLPAI